ncbi:hypothetical protein [Dictyobacter arantiisoli]|uniref:Uncharacterized protein n=1 Tax=Dictyobacter arantiisoli TaxID=2014874 RepID=A0A5A5TEB1_9CHLR|nr:hypothetical protein [Dictyobacter arantiisoli]GCF09890.1 hypothetical protein KDI_34540 [Dictyobacter arantiisoli]
MNDETILGGSSELRGNYQTLGLWLQQILQRPEPSITETATADNDGEAQLELTLAGNYHLSFYQQLPDFIMALLNNDLQAPLTYAPLLFHLAACRECHSAYLDLYSSMHAAVYPIATRPLLGQGTRTLSATPHRMLSHLSQSLISQAEAILLQARHEHMENDAAARSLLQLALRVSAHITQSTLRREALKDLVRVATLFEQASTSYQSASSEHSYTPVLATSGNTRRGAVVRRADSSVHAHTVDNAVIRLQAQSLEGNIVQRGEILELQLHNLEESLRGSFVIISVFLGSLLEPVRWSGGNPGAIMSVVPVDENGTLITPLGTTDLRLTQPEERNLLEATFMLLNIHKHV